MPCSDFVLYHHFLLRSVRTTSEAIDCIKERQDSDPRLESLRAPNKKDIRNRVFNLNESAQKLGYKDISHLLLDRYTPIPEEKKEFLEYLIPRTFQKYENYLEIRERLEKHLRDASSEINFEINLVIDEVRAYRKASRTNFNRDYSRIEIGANFLYDCKQFSSIINSFLEENKAQDRTEDESPESKIIDFYQIIIQQRFFTKYSKFVGVSLEEPVINKGQNSSKIVINFKPSDRELELAKIMKEIFEIEKNHLFFKK